MPDPTPHLRFLWRSLPALADGLLVTLWIAAAALAFAVAWALALLWPRLSARRAVALPVRAYVEIVRNTPLLVQIYLLYFGLPLLGVPLSAAATGVVAIGLQHGGYLLEIFRGAVRSIAPTQWDAGAALGLRRFAVFRLVILPQALMRVVPPTTNQLIVLVKDTTLVAAISVMDLTLTGKMILERSAASEVFVAIAFFYLAMTSLLGGVMRAVERRLRHRV